MFSTRIASQPPSASASASRRAASSSGPISPLQFGLPGRASRCTIPINRHRLSSPSFTSRSSCRASNFASVSAPRESTTRTTARNTRRDVARCLESRRITATSPAPYGMRLRGVRQLQTSCHIAATTSPSRTALRDSEEARFVRRAARRDLCSRRMRTHTVFASA